MKKQNELIYLTSGVCMEELAESLSMQNNDEMLLVLFKKINEFADDIVFTKKVRDLFVKLAEV